MQPIILAYWSIRRISLVPALLAIASVFYCLNSPPPVKNGFESTNDLWTKLNSFQESRQIVSDAAPLMTYCSIQFPPGDWFPLRKEYLLQVLNCAMNLAQSGDPNAEYIIGWMYENGLQSRPLDQNSLYRINSVDTRDPEAATQWYERADAHGSPDAPLALGRLKGQGGSYLQSQKEEIVGWYEKAIARGNADAKIELGQIYEDLNTTSGAKRAMELYEEAAKVKSADTVNSAVLHLLWLWKSNRARPSAEFSRSKSTAFDFLSIFEPDLNSEKFANFFKVCGCTPDYYGQYRGEILPKIRHALGLSSASAAAPIMSRGLKDSNQNLRDQSSSALAELGDGAVSELARLLSDRSSETRLESLHVLTKLGRDAEPAVSPMIALLVNDPDDRIRQEVKTELRLVGPAAEPALVKLLNDSSARVRADAAEVLASVGSKTAVPALMKLLQAPEEELFGAAADTLGAIGPDATAAMPTLIHWLQYPDRDTRHRAAHHAICMNFKAAAVPALVRSLQSNASESQRKQIACCLFDLGRDAEASVPALIESIRSEPSPALRIYLVGALARTGAHCPDAISALKFLAQKDQRPEVRQEAAERLDEISRGFL